MTVKRAESITGYEVRMVAESRSGVAYAAFRADVEVARASEMKPGETLRLLVEKVYKIHSKIVLEKQKYRCLLCGGRFPLDIDHIKPRSKGRDDRVENLRAICSAFYGCRAHARKHGG